MKAHKNLLTFITIFFTTVHPLCAQQSDIRPQERKFADTITIEFFREWPIVPVSINGTPMRFIFDTGASYSVISPKVLPEGSQILSVDSITDSNGITEKVEFTDLCGFSLGRLNFPCHRAFQFSFDEHPMFKCAQVDGFIGGNILQHLAVKIDKRNKQLIVTDCKKWFKVDKKKESPIKIEGGNRPYIELFIGDIREENVLLDTGSNGFYSMSSDVFSQMQALGSALWKGEVVETLLGAERFSAFGFAQSSDSIYRLNLSEWRINGVLFKNMQTTTAAAGYSLVGSKLLDYGQLIIDYPRKKFAFLPYDNTESITLDEDGKGGFSIGIDEDKHIILGMLSEDSDLYRQGARQGDQLIEINRRELNDDFCRAMEVGKDDLKEMKIKDKEGNIKVIYKN